MKRTSGRYCPRCHGESQVLHVRDTAESTWRRRQCQECGHRWSTRERFDETAGDDDFTMDSAISGADIPQP